MFYKEIHEMGLRVSVLFVVMIAGLIFLVAARPIAVSMMEEMYKDFDQLPETLQKLLGDPSTVERLEDDSHYIVSQWQGNNLGQFTPIIVLLIAFPIFARETDKGTIFFLLSRKKRSTVFWNKILAGLLVSLSLVLSLSILGPIFMRFAGYDATFGNTFLVMVHQIIGISFFHFLFSIFSIVFNDQIKPVMIGIGVVLAMPFASLVDSLKYINLYPYIMGTRIIDQGRIDWAYSAVLSILVVLLLMLSHRFFKNKEF